VRFLPLLGHVKGTIGGGDQEEETG
jgi:hypothetical protein